MWIELIWLDCIRWVGQNSLGLDWVGLIGLELDRWAEIGFIETGLEWIRLDSLDWNWIVGLRLDSLGLAWFHGIELIGTGLDCTHWIGLN